jgi:hypothetical protein
MRTDAAAVVNFVGRLSSAREGNLPLIRGAVMTEAKKHKPEEVIKLICKRVVDNSR